MIGHRIKLLGVACRTIGLVAVVVAAAGCQDASPPADVAVTNSMFECAVVDLAGDDAAIMRLAEPGMCPGHFDMRPSQVESLRGCRVLLRLDFQQSLDGKLVGVSGGGLRITEPGADLALALAIAGLTEVGETQAITALRELLRNGQTPANLRLAAAQALSQLGGEKLFADAQALATSGKMLERLYAATLLSEQTDSAAHPMLQQLAADEEPAVAATALEQILGVEPSLVADQWNQLKANPDDKVRLLLAKITKQDAKPASIPLLSAMLDDPHPGIRDYATDALIELAAREQFDRLVRESMTSLLTDTPPRPQELAVIVLGSLDHEPAADRFVELLQSKHPEVATAAAWALSQLLVPMTGPPMQKLVEQQMKITNTAAAKMRAAGDGDYEVPDFSDMYRQQEHLLIALGKLQHEPAATLLREYLHKPPLLKDTDPPYVETYRQQPLRAAAIWALSKLYEDNPPADLAEAVYARATDEDLSNAESSEVRAMSAIALARFGRDDDKTVRALVQIRESAAASPMLAAAASWAVGQLTGEEPAPLNPVIKTRLDWFLRPVEVK